MCCYPWVRNQSYNNYSQVSRRKLIAIGSIRSSHLEYKSTQIHNQFDHQTLKMSFCLRRYIQHNLQQSNFEMTTYRFSIRRYTCKLGKAFDQHCVNKQIHWCPILCLAIKANQNNAPLFSSRNLDKLLSIICTVPLSYNFVPNPFRRHLHESFSGSINISGHPRLFEPIFSYHIVQ